MPIIRVKISSQTAHFFDLIFTFGLGVLSVYLAILAPLITRSDAVWLVLAAIIHFYFFRKIYKYEMTLWGWSLPAIIWCIPAIYSGWMIYQHLLKN